MFSTRSRTKPEFRNILYLLTHFLKILPDLGINSKKWVLTLTSLFTSQLLFGAYFLVLLCNILLILVTENSHSGSASYIKPGALLIPILLFWSLLRHLSLALEGGSLYHRQLANSSRHLERLLKSLEKCMELLKFQGNCWGRTGDRRSASLWLHVPSEAEMPEWSPQTRSSFSPWSSRPQPWTSTWIPTSFLPAHFLSSKAGHQIHCSVCFLSASYFSNRQYCKGKVYFKSTWTM